MLKGKYAWIAEAFGGILLFLLPLKFGTLVAIPNMTLIYWSDPVSLIIGVWPFPVFPVLASAFLVLTLLLVPGEIFSGRAGKFAGFWLLLTLVSFLGGIAKDTPPDAFIYFMDHMFSIGAFLLGFTRIVTHNKNVMEYYYGAFSFAFLISLAIGLNQYFSGYQETINQIQSQNMAEVNGNILFRLRQMRISGGFSACNAFAGYLVLGLPITLAWLWRMGSRFTPPMVSRIVFTVPVLIVSLFLLVKTGSRGGLLSLLAAVFFFFFSSKMARKWRFFLFSLIPLGIIGMTALVMLGRGGKSILFRLDYFQGAFRMIAKSPLFGVGWGGFQRHFMSMKWIYDPEAPASPHSFPLSMGAQTGVLGFVLACVILIFGFYFLFRYLMKSSMRENLQDKQLMVAASVAAISGFTVHSLQDILFETPGAIVCYGAVVIMSLLMIEPEEKEESLEQKHPVFRFSCLIMTLLYAGIGLFIAWNVLAFDRSLATLNDMTDFRMIPPDEYANIDPVKVQNAFEEVLKKNPHSPYSYMTMSDYYMACGDMFASKAMVQKALVLDPASASFNVRMYRILFREQNYEEAAVYRKKAIELFPMNHKYKDLKERP